MATDKDTNIPRKTDYISREAAIEAAFDYRVDVIENDYDKGYTKAVRDIAKELNTIPTADVRPVVRGEWINVSTGHIQIFRCDQCGEETLDTCMGQPRANFCPNCGADMMPEPPEKETV